jgi:hypothetical protein
MPADVEVTTVLCQVTCCHVGCGILFGVPKVWESKRRQDHSLFFCPNGHQQHWAAKSDLEIVREAQRVAELKASEELARRLKAEEAAMQLGVKVNRLKRRAAAGVCPCCKRSFVALQRHMKTKHPSYAKGEANA